MGFGANFFSATTTFGGSIFDIGSDLINALDFLGYNASTTLSDSFSKSSNLRHDQTLVDISDETSKADCREIYESNQIWGALGILILFIS